MLHRIIKNGCNTATDSSSGACQITVCGNSSTKRHRHMGMCIKCSRQHKLTGCIYDFLCVYRKILAYRYDFSTIDRYICRKTFRCSNDGSTFNQ